jgi:hypothetical protein
MGLFRRLVFRPLSLINQRRLGWLQFIFRLNRKQASPLELVHHRLDHIFRRERIIFGGERSPGQIRRRCFVLSAAQFGAITVRFANDSKKGHRLGV